MKRVGIITIHNSPNYGACLQSFALYKYIELQNADCEIMDVHRPVHRDYIYEKEYSSYRNNPFAFRRRFPLLVKRAVKSMLGRSAAASDFATDLSRERFREFNAAIKYSKTYNRLSDLKRDPPVYDLYISGSDQLWNPGQPYCLEPYFLTFVPAGKQKISYATSIGITELSGREQKDFKRWLASYDAISVREGQAKELLDSFVGKEITRVADPTFLLDASYWRETAIYPSGRKGYILVFLLSRNQAVLDYAERLAKESGKELVILRDSGLKTVKGRFTIDNDCGPREWIGYLGNASMVITDSFHCTVFSILMGAGNFYSYINPSSKRGSRITDLLTTFGLQNHLLPDNFSAGYRELSLSAVDDGKVSAIIEQERERGREFLDKWIKDE